MTGRRFPPPWSVEELDAMTRHTKVKSRPLSPISRTLTQSKRNMDHSRRPRVRRRSPSDIG
jgi:hypothetical protein